MTPTATATNKLLCSIPAYAYSLPGLITFARREWGKVGYSVNGQPHLIRINPANLNGYGEEFDGVKIVRDAKIPAGKMRVE